ncbi:hypothetical protein ACN47E_010114 [Coniothyrium glycines]
MRPPTPMTKRHARERFPEPLDERSPRAASTPIPIPGRDVPRCHLGEDRLPFNWKATKSRPHHYTDNVTDYFLPWSNGWAPMQALHLAEKDKNTGRILQGAWPPTERFHRRRVVRKEIVMEDSQTSTKTSDWADEQDRKQQLLDIKKGVKQRESEMVQAVSTEGENEDSGYKTAEQR